ncbi:LpqB family beta-propeller domain-containing protein [Cellulomonas sp. P22]|uniref:LpqB family beta-propeller domain-containing protein n=1 Tax=Cellulomonas sp. P22 TaxID=3373189 RepID=UPI0037B16868
MSAPLVLHRRRHAYPVLAAVLAMLTAGALAACAAIPTDGPVSEGVEDVSELAPVTLLGDSPGEDASPQQIVDGFLNASAAGFSRESTADISKDFSVAREYLAGEARDTWDPGERVVVYSAASSPESTMLTDTQVQVRVGVAARVDSDGRYQESGPETQESLVFDLVMDSAGQWRISGLDDGVVLSQPNFNLVYRTATLYFLSADSTYLVPETRSFPVRNLATSVVRALVEGPSPWLQDAVRTAVPDGMHLTTPAVPVDPSGTADVSLTGAALSDPTERALLMAQLEASLRIPRVSAVQLTVGDVPLDWEPARLERSVLPADTALEVVQGDALVALTDGELTPVDEVGALTGLQAGSTARNEQGNVRVLLSDGDALVRAPTTQSGSAQPLVTGVALADPSVDRFGWAWTASASPEGPVLTAARSDGTQQVVQADWLAGRTVREVRVARDGSRVAILSTGDDGPGLDVAGVVRGGVGVPQQLGEPLATGAMLTDATRVVWFDETTLAVVGKVAGATSAGIHLVPVAGPTRAAPSLEGIVSVAGGKADRSLYAATADGQLWSRSGQRWVSVATGVHDPSFPG